MVLSSTVNGCISTSASGRNQTHTLFSYVGKQTLFVQMPPLGTPLMSNFYVGTHYVYP